MHDNYNQTGGENASGTFSRRFLLSSAAAIAVPVAAPAAETETPMDKLLRLSHEMAAALDEWQDGAFNAMVYPARFNNGTMDLRERPKSPGDEITLYIGVLRGILARMHPDANVSASRCWHEGSDDIDIIVSVRHPSAGSASDKA